MKKKPVVTNRTTRAFETAAASSPELSYVLRLFVVGMSPKSQDAIANVRELCEEHIKDRYELEVIDLHQHPLAASLNQIIAVPTLIKKLPLPIRKFVGDMTKSEKILTGLDLRIEVKK